MSRRRLLRLILFAALAVGLMILGHQIGASPSPAALRARIAAAGPVGPLLFLGVFVAGQHLHAPGVPFIATAILCFGKVQGGVLAWAGALHYLLGSSLGLIPPLVLCAVFFDWLVRRL
jgi:uncharacterized membrane protein YdjX (TVP38/TMEM64 family)